MANRLGSPRDLSKIGSRHGRLVIVSDVYKDSKPAWECKCDCGNIHVVKNADLRNTKSCGCFRRDCSRASHTTHGMTKTKTYQAWRQMISRCSNKNNHAYKNYGGRGISVCYRWANSFELFLQDMGEPTEGQSLDRINNDGNYEPGNCRWTDSITQANNRRTNVFLNGKTIAQAAKESGHSVQVLSWRIYKMGMSLSEAMATPKLRRREASISDGDGR